MRLGLGSWQLIHFFALSPVLTNLSEERILLLGPFVRNASRCRAMQYINIYDGKVHAESADLAWVPHTFDLMLAQYWRTRSSRVSRRRARGAGPTRAAY
jgi:hypothetical protein